MENLNENGNVQKNFCANCGSELNPNAQFCGNCGAPVQKAEVQQPANVQPTYNQTNTNNNFTNNIPPEYQPISMWGYFGYELLFSIPCIGFILLLVFSFGGTKNQNLRNFARSYFCYMILVAVLAFIFILIFGGIGAFTSPLSSNLY